MRVLSMDVMEIQLLLLLKIRSGLSCFFKCIFNDKFSFVLEFQPHIRWNFFCLYFEQCTRGGWINTSNGVWNECCHCYVNGIGSSRWAYCYNHRLLQEDQDFHWNCTPKNGDQGRFVSLTLVPLEISVTYLHFGTFVWVMQVFLSISFLLCVVVSKILCMIFMRILLQITPINA